MSNSDEKTPKPKESLSSTIVSIPIPTSIPRVYVLLSHYNRYSFEGCFKTRLEAETVRRKLAIELATSRAQDNNCQIHNWIHHGLIPKGEQFDMAVKTAQPTEEDIRDEEEQCFKIVPHYWLRTTLPIYIMASLEFDTISGNTHHLLTNDINEWHNWAHADMTSVSKIDKYTVHHL